MQPPFGFLHFMEADSGLFACRMMDRGGASGAKSSPSTEDGGSEMTLFAMSRTGSLPSNFVILQVPLSIGGNPSSIRGCNGTRLGQDNRADN